MFALGFLKEHVFTKLEVQMGQSPIVPQFWWQFLSFYLSLFFMWSLVETKNSKDNKDTGTQYKHTKNEGKTDMQGSEHRPIK